MSTRVYVLRKAWGHAGPWGYANNAKWVDTHLHLSVSQGTNVVALP